MVGDGMVRKAMSVKQGSPVGEEIRQGVRASIGAKKHGNTCGAKGSRKVDT